MFIFLKQFTQPPQHKKKKWFLTFSCWSGKIAITGIMKFEDGPQTFLSVRHNKQ